MIFYSDLVGMIADKILARRDSISWCRLLDGSTGIDFDQIDQAKQARGFGAPSLCITDSAAALPTDD